MSVRASGSMDIYWVLMKHKIHLPAYKVSYDNCLVSPTCLFEVAGLAGCLGPLVSNEGSVSVLEIEIWLLSWSCPVTVAGLGGGTNWWFMAGAGLGLVDTGC